MKNQLKQNVLAVVVVLLLFSVSYAYSYGYMDSMIELITNNKVIIVIDKT